MNRPVQYISWITLIAAILLIVLAAYWLFYPYQLAEVKSPYKVLNNPVVAGENMRFMIEFDKHVDLNATISRQLVNDVTITYPSVVTNTRAGHHEYIVELPTPEYVDEGEYIFKHTACYHVNPLRTICLDYESEVFQIIK